MSMKLGPDVDGILMLVEVDSEPPTPPGTTAYVYAQDNGTGTQQTVIKYPAGDPQVLAQETP